MLYRDKLNERAIERLISLERRKDDDSDWVMIEPWQAPFIDFITRCTKEELKVIINLAMVSKAWAYDVLWNLFFNEGVEFPFDDVTDMHITHPNQKFFNFI